MKVRVEVSALNENVLIRYRLVQRKYSNYGSGEAGKVKVVGIFKTEYEAKQEKKRLLSKKHEPYSLMYKIEPFVVNF